MFYIWIISCSYKFYKYLLIIVKFIFHLAKLFLLFFCTICSEKVFIKMLDSVSNNNIYRKNSNIKFEGYLKNRKKLMRDFLVADFKYKNSQTFEYNSSLLDSHKKLVKFFNENPLRTFLFNLFDRITSTKSKKNFKNQEPFFLREQVAKVKQQFQNLRFNFNGESFTIIDFINNAILLWRIFVLK